MADGMDKKPKCYICEGESDGPNCFTKSFPIELHYGKGLTRLRVDWNLSVKVCRKCSEQIKIGICGVLGEVFEGAENNLKLVKPKG